MKEKMNPIVMPYGSMTKLREATLLSLPTLRRILNGNCPDTVINRSVRNYAISLGGVERNN